MYVTDYFAVHKACNSDYKYVHTASMSLALCMYAAYMCCANGRNLVGNRQHNYRQLLRKVILVEIISQILCTRLYLVRCLIPAPKGTSTKKIKYLETMHSTTNFKEFKLM